MTNQNEVLAIAAAYEAGATTRELSAQLHRCRSTIRAAVVAAGNQMRPAAPRKQPKRPPSPPIDPEDLSRLAEAYRAGHSTMELAEAIDMSYKAARTRLKRAGVEMRRPGGSYQAETTR